MKNYVKPMMESEVFTPNEYVAACVTGTIQCAIPGRSPYRVNDGTDSRNFSRNIYLGLGFSWDGPRIRYDGRDHGICGESTTINFSDSNGTGSGYEMNHGVLDTSRPIYNISGYDLAEGTYNVTWQSNNGSQEYNHYGTLNIVNIDDSRPNHS